MSRPLPTSAALGERLDQLTTRVEAQPGVESAGAAISLPTQLTPDLPFDIMGRPTGQQGSSGEEKYIQITAHYFSAILLSQFSPARVEDLERLLSCVQRGACGY